VSPKEQSLSVRNYPFGDPALLRLDPYPLYEHLRREEPLCRVQMPYGEEAWLATRYKDVKMVLGDARFSRAAATGRDQPRTAQRSGGNFLFALDPPEHTWLRSLLAKAFTARRVEHLRSRTQEMTDALVDGMLAAGPPADLVAELAEPLPLSVISELLGIPEADRRQFRQWSESVISTTSLPIEQVRSYMESMRQYMAGQVARRRSEPADDLLGAIVREWTQNERYRDMAEHELVALTTMLLAAGFETTITQIGNMMYVLMQHAEQWSALCAEPGLIPSAVEELLRFIPLGVASLLVRYPTEDVMLGGVLVRKGEPVLPAVYSANRDEEAFPCPDRLDVRRQGQPHFAFGHGAHHCLGAQLVRMELSVVLGTLARRMPSIALAVPEEELRWKKGLTVRGPASLPVTW
jgi:cytochrome P450